VLEGPPDGLRHADEQFVRVGGAVVAEEARAPAIELAARGGGQGISFEIGPIVRGVGKRIASGGIVDICGVKADRRMVETDIAARNAMKKSPRT
jgi:hypothetical protein